jgi:hypothetical protein
MLILFNPHSPMRPTLIIPNIINFIKGTLDIGKGQYKTWCKTFKIHVWTYQVLDHIIPPSPNDPTPIASLKETNPTLW